MVSSNFSFLEGNSINRPLIFNGEGYHYWKTRIQISIEKPREQWNEDERRRVQYNLKAKNIITFVLGMDEYFRVSNCKIAKEMWDTLQVTHEGTTDVKRSRINTLTHEYELFRMNQNETIQDMQKIFTHIVNHLASFEKIFPNEDLINKVLRCLSKTMTTKSNSNYRIKRSHQHVSCHSLWETSRI